MRESVEFLRPVKDRWVAGVIEFGGARPIIREPQSCMACHGSATKPLWGDDPAWVGTELDSMALYYDSVWPSSHVRDPDFARLLDAMQSTDPRAQGLACGLSLGCE